jgi:hypothetical protein
MIFPSLIRWLKERFRLFSSHYQGKTGATPGRASCSFIGSGSTASRLQSKIRPEESAVAANKSAVPSAAAIFAQAADLAGP